MKVANKICAAALVATTAALLFCGGAAWTVLSRAFKKNAAEWTKVIAERGALTLEHSLFGRVETAAAPVASAATRVLHSAAQKGEPFPREELLSCFFDMLSSVPEVLSCGVYLPDETNGNEPMPAVYAHRDGDGKPAEQVLSVALSDMPRDDPEHEWFRGPFDEGRSLWDEPGEWEGVVMMAYSFPFFDENGRVAGVFCFDVAADTLSSVLSGCVDEGTAYMTSRDGSRIAARAEGIPEDEPFDKNSLSGDGTHAFVKKMSSGHLLVVEIPGRVFFKHISSAALASALVLPRERRKAPGFIRPAELEAPRWGYIA